MVRGKMVMKLYDDKGSITDEFVMEHCGVHPMVQVEAGQWHSLEVLEEGTVIFEAKDGVLEPIKNEEILRNPSTQLTSNRINRKDTQKFVKHAADGHKIGSKGLHTSFRSELLRNWK